MVVIRCTQKLLKRVGQPLSPSQPSTTRLGDWYANLLGVGHQRYVLFVSEQARLPVLIPARDVQNLGAHLSVAVALVLARLGVARDAVDRELQQMHLWTIGRTTSRSVLGSITDFSRGAWVRLRQEPDADLINVSLWLAETPILVFGGASPDSMAPELLL